MLLSNSHDASASGTYQKRGKGAFYCLLVSNFICAFVLGAMQFYMLETVVSHYGDEARDWLVQIVSALITIGPVIAYFVSGTLAAAYKKAYVMAWSSAATLVVMLYGMYSAWWPSPWVYIFLVGALLGVYSAGKMSSVPLAAKRLQKSTPAINAWMSVIFLVGILTGLPTGTWLYMSAGYYAIPSLCILLGISIVFSLLSVFGNETRTPLGEMVIYMGRKTRTLFRRHGLYLCAGPFFWGVGSATNLAMTAYVVTQDIASPQHAAFIPVWAACGVVAGTLISPVFRAYRFCAACLAGIGMAIAIICLPLFAVAYPIIVASIIVVGIAFGIATNLIDSTYLERVSSAHNEGIGAALQSAMLSLLVVCVGGSVGFSLLAGIVAPRTQFPFLMALCLIPVVLTGILWRRDTRGSRRRRENRA